MPPFDFSTEWLVHLPKMPQWQHFLELRCHRRLYKVVLGHTQNSDWGLHWWQILQISQLFSKKPRNDDQNLKITADLMKLWNFHLPDFQSHSPLYMWWWLWSGFQLAFSSLVLFCWREALDQTVSYLQNIKQHHWNREFCVW